MGSPLRRLAAVCLSALHGGHSAAAGLRLNHAARQDELELQPQQPETRAEAAYSLAQILPLAEILRFGQGSRGRLVAAPLEHRHRDDRLRLELGPS